MNKSRIQWTDYTWSPVTGCSKVSQGCKNCYAEAWHKRFRGGDFGVKLHPEKIGEAMRALHGFESKHGRRPRVFVCPMADLFHNDVPDEFIEQVWWTMALCTHIDFIVLTKRPARMQELLSIESFIEAVTALSDEYPLPNVWIGVTAESQQEADRRIPILLQTPAAIRWVSIEPMLGPLDLTSIKWAKINAASSDYERFGVQTPIDLWSMNNVLDSRPADAWNKAKTGLDWVVCGGESGAGARPLDTEWVRSLRDQCYDARVPFFFKQWGADGGPTSDDYGLPILDGYRHKGYPSSPMTERP